MKKSSFFKRKSYKSKSSPIAKINGGEVKMSLEESYKWFNNKKSFPTKLRGKWVSIANKKIIESGKDVVELVKKTESKIKAQFLIAKIPNSRDAFLGLRFLK